MRQSTSRRFSVPATFPLQSCCRPVDAALGFPAVTDPHLAEPYPRLSSIRDVDLWRATPPVDQMLDDRGNSAGDGSTFGAGRGFNLVGYIRPVEIGIVDTLA